MAKGIMRGVTAAQKNAFEEMQGLSGSGDHVAGGLSSEGYAGGYFAALSDVILALNGVQPNNSRYWPERLTTKEAD